MRGKIAREARLTQDNLEASVLEAYVNMRKWGRQILLAICDAEILGKTFQESGMVFEVKEDFYRGFRTNVEDAVSLIEKSSIVNLVGCNTVKKAVERGYVHPEAVIEICGVLHAQVVKI